MNKNILIPGGIGYIGSHVVVDLLLKTTYNLTILDNYTNCTPQSLDKIYKVVSSEIGQYCQIQVFKSRVNFYQASILDLGRLEDIFQLQAEMLRPITSVMHFAAKKSAPQSVSQPLQYFENNLLGSMNLLKVMQKHGSCKQFIFSSSAAVYGEQDNCTEQFNCNPISPYGETKLCVDMLLKSMAFAHKDWKIISLRYFNPAGNHPSGHIGDNPIGNIPGNLFSIIQQYIIGKRTTITVFGRDYNTVDGSGVRDFIHVVDLAQGHLKALQYLKDMNAQKNYEVFNLGSGTGYSVIQVIKMFEEILGKSINYEIGGRRVGDLQRLVTASKKAQMILGWKTKKTLKQMCQSCISFTSKLI